MLSPATLQRLLVVVAVLVSVAVVYALDRPRGSWGTRLRKRFILGVPWGTLSVSGFVLAVYLLLQGGLWHWYNPTVIPFRAWSYFYPLGILTASFTHAGPGHLLGNLIGTLTLAPIVEYVWGHFPRERGASSFGNWRTNPFVRAFVVFPGVVVVAGLLSAAFSVGPVIGFSGVVFAFAGFSLTRYPIATVIALTAGRVLSLVRFALRNPVTTASGHPAFVTPWWADIAIQGHALGLLGGVMLGVASLRRRGGDRPSALRLWTGALLFAVSQSLWAVYWFRGGGTYVLYRAVGTALVFGLAALLAAAVSGGDDPLSERLAEGVRGSADTVTAAVRTASARQVGLVVLFVSAAALAGPAVPVNLFTTAGGDLPGDEIQVRDYEVTYAEDVRNGMVSVVNVTAFGETTGVNASGVIVRSTDRGIWTTAVTKRRLAFAGRVRVYVGGVGWQESVSVTRRGWTALDGGAAYRVNFTHDGRTRTVYRSEPAVAAPVIGGRNLSIAPAESDFLVVVTTNDTARRAPIPRGNETVTVLGVEFARENATIVARYNETVVTVFRKETYRGK